MLILKIRRTKMVHNIADYTYSVLVNLEEIAHGEIEGHNRADGWAVLVKAIAEQYLKESDDTHPVA